MHRLHCYRHCGLVHTVRAPLLTITNRTTRHSKCAYAVSTVTGASKNQETHIEEPPQISILRERLENRQAVVEASKLKCDIAQKQLQKHLQGLKDSNLTTGCGKPLWLVTQMNTAPYDAQLPRCCGAFTNKQDALLRMELLQTRPNDHDYNYQDYIEHYVVCVCLDPTDATYSVDLDSDCLEPPKIVS